MAALHKDYIIVGNKSEEATATAQISMEKLLDNILKYGTYAILGVYAMFKICPIEEALFGIALSPSLFCIGKKYIFCNTGYFCGERFRWQAEKVA